MKTTDHPPSRRRPPRYPTGRWLHWHPRLGGGSPSDRLMTNSDCQAIVDGTLQLARPVVGAAHRVVDVAVAEVKYDGRALFHLEECGKPSRACASGFVGVEGDDERMRELEIGRASCRERRGQYV